MRLIDADALMETIRAHEYPLRSHFNSTDRGMFTVGIQQAVDEQPTFTASPWHRVEDELPQKATWVLTVATDENVKLFNIATVDAGGQWWTCSPQKILRELYGVRYWMPIEPPKEGNK